MSHGMSHASLTSVFYSSVQVFNECVDSFYWKLLLWDKLVGQIEEWKAEQTVSDEFGSDEDEGSEMNEALFQQVGIGI